jgi:dTDP-glucose 4,6-dehydratase
MKILVTGGAGFIGSHFLEMLYQDYTNQFKKITVIDNLTYAGKMENLKAVPSDFFEFVHGDIMNPDVVKNLVSKNDLVVNFAAESHVDNSINDADKFIGTNIVGTYNVLESIKQFPNCRLIQISTDEVYGSIKEGSWSEESALAPNSPYSASKASSDLLSLAYEKTFNLDITVTRCSNNFGVRQYPEKIIPLFVKKIVEGKRVTLYGDGSNRRDWLHVIDHCYGIMTVIEKGISGNIYNFGGGTELTNLELTTRIIKILGQGNESIDFVTDRKGHDFRYSVDTNKAQTQLDWNPKMDFEQELIKTVNWYSDEFRKSVYSQ